MIALFELLIYGHVHKWKEDDRYPLVDDDAARIGSVVYCTCVHCGEPRRFKLV